MMHNLKLEPRGDDLDAVELELISQYICHEMTPAEEQAFERRLADDEGFYDRVFPLLDAWYDTDSWPVEAAVVEPAVRPVGTSGGGWTRWAGKTSTRVAAAGIVGAAILRAALTIGVGSEALVAHKDGPVPPAATESTVIAVSHNPRGRVKHRIEPSTVKAVATPKIDTAAERLVGERVLAQLALAAEADAGSTPPRRPIQGPTPPPQPIIIGPDITRIDTVWLNQTQGSIYKGAVAGSHPKPTGARD